MFKDINISIELRIDSNNLNDTPIIDDFSIGQILKNKRTRPSEIWCQCLSFKLIRECAVDLLEGNGCDTGDYSIGYIHNRTTYFTLSTQAAFQNAATSMTQDANRKNETTITFFVFSPKPKDPVILRSTTSQ